MAHCWNRVEGRDVDPAEELVLGMPSGEYIFRDF